MSNIDSNNQSLSAANCTRKVLILLSALFFSANSLSEEASSAIVTPSTAPATEIQLVEKDTDVFYLEAKLGNSAASEFLFDTGSGYLAINVKVLDRLKSEGDAQYRRSIRARLASGAINSLAVYSIASLDLGGGCVLHDVEAAILPGSTRNILGMNVLKMVDSFSVSFKPAKLVLSGCGQPAPEVVATL
ncbi:retropepsin-like aspartic protease family protein [Zhongshania aquimaris]|uniref:Retroviral-like aspartic protease family protein n=1 Tax=Zhongshania aquimaris TaxID=2857107 RepID=A0ABS6VPR6_9GAMM|nr:retropepsin-like aspartic protease [Zhongshania aquimaris]MBW2939716.1 retroviral-like aspartic protease family protein [Zhongshania aquimaris]